MNDAGLNEFDKLMEESANASINLRRRFLQGQPVYEPSDVTKRFRERIAQLDAEIAAVLQPPG